VTRPAAAQILDRPENLALFLPFARHNCRQGAANSGKRFPRLETVFIGDYATFGKARPRRSIDKL
jgi:hypothetical protein